MTFRVIGINRTQDGSISVFEDGRHISSIHKERITRIKHDWGKLGDLDLYKSAIPELHEPIDLVVECFSSDTEIENDQAYKEELLTLLNTTDRFQRIHISHHLSHLYSCYSTSGFQNSAAIIIDFQGSYLRDVDEYPNKGVENLLEVASYYKCIDGEIVCIKKQLWDGDKSRPQGLGAFYHQLSKSLFEGSSPEGKVMGLCSYGNADRVDLPDLIFDKGDVLIPKEWAAIFEDKITYRFESTSSTFQEKADLAAKAQQVFQEALVKAIDWLHEATGLENLCYAGGCGLNVIANTYIKRESRFTNIFIPPSPHDGGTSVGCGIYGVTEIAKQPLNFRWENDYLGPSIDFKGVEDLMDDKSIQIKKLDDPIEHCANLLCEGQIVAVYQSHSEFGPRALGNRSFIADPRFEITKYFLNHRIKGREWFRPVAPLVRTEDVNTYFEHEGESRYMLYTYPIKEEYRDLLGAVNHRDQTARVQTVDRTNNPFIYDLLGAFYDKSGVGVLINTSFNKKGDPIVETMEEAIDCLRTTHLNYLLIGDYLVSKRDLDQNPLMVDQFT